MAKPLTHEQAIEHSTELQRRVSVGAYLELEHDGSFPPDDGTPESTTLESIANLERWAERQGLEFRWNHESKTWSLEPTLAKDRAAMNAWLARHVEESEADNGCG